ncbi:hypothetical protein [Streptomyces avicenniae]|uniref:hypothetical protein n=1 Tax=Streptomyces avicenniae TaxID=500153 RepID=UPI00069BFE7E|nr:hypothetical protein [Streptomyces avicenniae]
MTSAAEVTAVTAVTYAEGWDLSACRPLTPLSRAEAEGRDAAGEPYVVVHRAAGRSVPVEVHLIAWEALYVGVWAYDARGRRVRETDWRLIEPDRLFLRHAEEWRYDDEDAAEFAPDVWHTTVDVFPGDNGFRTVEPDGRRGIQLHAPTGVPEEDRWRGRAAFGVHALASPGPEPAPGTHEDGGDGGDGGDCTAGEPATRWLPPRPAEAAFLRELFEPGTRLATDIRPEMTVGEPREIARLRLPSGRLAVADP